MATLVALILAKRNSTRLPNKNLLEVDGVPMFLVNVRKCLRLFDQVYVSSDSAEMLQMASKAGARTIKRGQDLCGDVPNITVYKHAIETMGDVDGIVAVQSNSPTVNPKLIMTVKGLLELGYNEVMTCHPLEHKKNYHKQAAKVYGSIWGVSRERLENYADPYKPEPEVLLVDSSVDIETPEDMKKVLCQSTHQ